MQSMEAAAFVETLHAIKAVSNTGDEKERGDNKPTAMEICCSSNYCLSWFPFGQKDRNIES